MILPHANLHRRSARRKDVQGREEQYGHLSLSGLHVAPIYAGCVDEGIAVIDTRHEQGAAHAADAYARLTRGVGIAVVTAGPGVTDALTGVANAFAANSPMILIGGAAPTFNAGKGSLQEIEQVDLFLRITKWADRIPSTAAIPSFLARAFRVALSGRPGPVFLEIPFDVLMNGVDEAEAPLPTGYRTKARSPGDPALIAEAAKRLDGAEKPAIIAGLSIWARRGRAPAGPRRARRLSRLPEWLRPRLSASGPPQLLPADAERSSPRGRRRAGGGYSARLSPRLRQPRRPSSPRPR